MSGLLFLFRSLGGDRLKVPYWDKYGYTLWHKAAGANLHPDMASALV